MYGMVVGDGAYGDINRSEEDMRVGKRDWVGKGIWKKGILGSMEWAEEERQRNILMLRLSTMK